MKIACLSTFYPFRGGIAQFNASLYRALEKENEVKAYTFTRQYPDFLFPGETQMVKSGDKVDAIPAERVLDTANPFSYGSAANKIGQFTPDLLLMKYWMSYMAPSLGSVAGRLKKKSKVVTILDNVIPHEKRFFDTAFTKYFLNRNHGFVVMSESVKRDLLSLKPDAKYIFHAHPLYDHFGSAADPKQSKIKLGIPEGKKVALFFGFIRDYKGLDLLIKALAKCSNDVVLVIAGEVYGSFEKYDQLMHELKLQDRVVKHNRYIADEEVPGFFAAADVCVLPYRSATQSGITSISYHFDLPMIATDTGGLKESIKDNENGLIVPQPDPDQIAVAIERYFAEGLKSKFIPEIQKMKGELSWGHLASAITDFARTL